MFKKFLKIIIAITVKFLLFFATCYASTDQKLESNSSLNITQSIVHLGGVNRKSFYAADTERMNWTDAWHYCDSFGMSLASIKTESEQDFIAVALRNPKYDLFTKFWLSAYDSGADYITEWEEDRKDNTVMSCHGTIELAWDRLPFDVPKGRYCGHLYPKHLNREEMYSVQGCDWTAFTLCQSIEGDTQRRLFAVERSRLQSTPSVKVGPAIEDMRHLGFVGRKSFYVNDKAQMNWNQAYRHCKSLNMSLGTLKTRKEFNFVENAIRDKNYLNYKSFWLSSQSNGPGGYSVYWNGKHGLKLSGSWGFQWDWHPGDDDYCGAIYSLFQYSTQKYSFGVTANKCSWSLGFSLCQKV